MATNRIITISIITVLVLLIMAVIYSKFKWSCCGWCLWRSGSGLYGESYGSVGVVSLIKALYIMNMCVMLMILRWHWFRWSGTFSSEVLREEINTSLKCWHRWKDIPGHISWCENRRIRPKAKDHPSNLLSSPYSDDHVCTIPHISIFKQSIYPSNVRKKNLLTTTFSGPSLYIILFQKLNSGQKPLFTRRSNYRKQ